MHTTFSDVSLDKIVTLLKSHQSSFLSGERLSKSLHLSRASVWKKIKKLKTLGYKIESKKNSGYRLISQTDLLLPWEITTGLQTEVIGQKIYYFDKIDSTQNFALNLAQKPHENGSVIIAQRQTKGRGRLNRKWISPKGGIWLSILLRPNFELSKASLLPMLTSLALAMAIENNLRLKPELKWPNDVTLNDKKVSGILIDTAIETNKIEYIIIGIGINFKINPRIISRSIKSKKYGITTLVEENKEASSVKFVQEFLYQFEILYNKLMSDSKEIQKEWTRRSSTIGKNVKVVTSTGITHGKAVSIDENGGLLLTHKGKTHLVLAGDVSYKKTK